MTPASRRGAWFAIGLLVGYVVLHVGYFSIPDPMLRDGFHHGLVRISAGVINTVRPAEAVTAQHNVLSSPRAALEIVRGCDGSGVVFILVAAVLAFAASLRQKIVGVLAGTAIILLLNQLRIIGLYFVAAYREAWFLPLHGYLIPSLLIVAATIFFMVWTQWVAEQDVGAMR